MNFDQMVVRPHPGEGLVARFPGVALVVAPGPIGDDSVDRLVKLVETVAASGPAPGRRLARQVAALLTAAEGEASPPTFCLLAQDDDGLVAMLHGSMEVDVTGPESNEQLSGAEVATWIDRVLPLPINRLVVRSGPGHDLDPDPRTRLIAGVVSGSGLTAIPAPIAADQPAPHLGSHLGPATIPDDDFEDAPVRSGPPPAGEAAEAPAAPPPVGEAATGRSGPSPAAEAAEARSAPPPAAEAAEAQSALSPAAEPAPAPPAPAPPPPIGAPLADPRGEPDLRSEPLPVAVSAPASEQAGGPVVQGVMCDRAHFNDPAAPFCAVCGIAMGQAGPLVEGPRPPLGIIVFDDGNTVVIDSELLLGREPDNDPAVLSGSARSVVVDDPARTVSRIHAGILLEGWTVKVVDRGSANGTFVAGPTDQDWVELMPHRPAVLKPGTRLRLGQRAFLVDSYPRGR